MLKASHVFSEHPYKMHSFIDSNKELNFSAILTPLSCFQIVSQWKPKLLSNTTHFLVFKCALQYLICTGGKPLNNKNKIVSKGPLKTAPLSKKTRLVDKKQINFICLLQIGLWPIWVHGKHTSQKLHTFVWTENCDKLLQIYELCNFLKV